MESALQRAGQRGSSKGFSFMNVPRRITYNDSRSCRYCCRAAPASSCVCTFPIFMRVSVAMCTYNGAQYLGEQLESFVAQSRPPDELVVCDDGSTDATPQILADFAGRAPFDVRIFRNKANVG